MDWKLLLTAASLLITVAGLLFTFGRFSGKLEDKTEHDNERFKYVEEKIRETSRNHEEHDEAQFSQLQKYATEFFERIQKLEITQAGQSEINKSTNSALENIRREQERSNTKLDTIEGLLRARRSTDQ